MGTKYYKYQSPGRTIFWYMVSSFFLIMPGAPYSVFESIMRLIMDPNVDRLMWQPIPFIVVFTVIFMVLKKNHSKTVTLMGNIMMLIFMGYNMPFLSASITSLVGNLASNINNVNEEIGIKGALSLILYISSFRIISRTSKSFGDLDPENDTSIVALWATIIIIYVASIVAAIIPFLFTGTNDTIQKQIEFPDAQGYISMISYLLYILLGVFMIKSGLTGYKSLKLYRKASKKSSTLKTSIFVIIFVFSWFPLLMPFVDGGWNDRNHSVYNQDWAGNSEFRDYVNTTMGYDVYSTHSSLSTLIRMNKSICLVIFGPTSMYNPIAEIPFFIDMFRNEDIDFSMLICDDHGSTGSLMIDLFLSSYLSGSGSSVPLALFPGGILWDNSSYEPTANPMFPIIQVSGSHPTTNGVNQVILSNASSILLGELLGWSSVGGTSSQYSFIDTNGNGMYDPKDAFPIPIDVSQFISGFENGIPLGGYSQTVFAYTEISAGDKIFLTADASMFNNDLIYEYDNLAFGRNIINWLTGGDNQDFAIVFDESHNVPTGTVEFSSPAMFGFFQGYVNWLSINPFLSWIYPLWAIRTLNGWLPKKDDKKKKKKKEEEISKKELEELKFRTSSFFAKKINWYRINKKYNQALVLLYRRIERKVNKMMGDIPPTIDNIIGKLEMERGKYISKELIERTRNFLIKIKDVKENKREIIDEEEFNAMFFEMSWFADFV